LIGCLVVAAASSKRLAAITGHRTAAMATLYTRRANQNRRAVSAIRKWEQADKPVNARRAK
jgi:hypothetical protein